MSFSASAFIRLKTSCWVSFLISLAMATVTVCPEAFSNSSPLSRYSEYLTKGDQFSAALEYSAAARSYSRALIVARQQLSGDESVLLPVLIKLSATYDALGSVFTSRALLEQATAHQLASDAMSTPLQDLVALAQLQHYGGLTKQSGETLRRILEHVPDDLESWSVEPSSFFFEAGVVLADLGNHKNAVRLLAKYILEQRSLGLLQSAELSEAFCYLGLLLHEKMDYAKSLVLFEHALTSVSPEQANLPVIWAASLGHRAAFIQIVTSNGQKDRTKDINTQIADEEERISGLIPKEAIKSQQERMEKFGLDPFSLFQAFERHIEAGRYYYPLRETLHTLKTLEQLELLNTTQGWGDLLRSQDRVRNLVVSSNPWLQAAVPTIFFGGVGYVAYAMLGSELKKQEESGQSQGFGHTLLKALHGIGGQMLGAAVSSGFEAIPEKIARKTFEEAQRVWLGENSFVFAQSNIIDAEGDGEVVRTVREHQKLLIQMRDLEGRIEGLLQDGVQPIRTRSLQLLLDNLERFEHKARIIEGRIIQAFPDYGKMMAPPSVKVKLVQKELRHNEALIAYLFSDIGAKLWVVRKESIASLSVPIQRSELAAYVSKLRTSLDISSGGRLRRFDVSLAHELYARLFQPAVPHLKNVDRIFVLPDSALESLPLSVLVASEPRSAILSVEDYRSVDWLVRKYAFSTIVGLIDRPKRRERSYGLQGRSEMLAFANPHFGATQDAIALDGYDMLEPHDRVSREAELATLNSLPETALEVIAASDAFGPTQSRVYFGTEASEATVRSIDLSRANVLFFATHSVQTSRGDGYSEPALALSSPTDMTLSDDGFLTASEISSLDIAANLVVLSACSTASAHGRADARAMTGLVQSFFRAGAKSAIASHWNVDSAAAAFMMSNFFKEFRKQRDAGREDVDIAEVLRSAELQTINNGEHSHFAHPALWSPFVVVEGRSFGGAGLEADETEKASFEKLIEDKELKELILRMQKRSENESLEDIIEK